MDVITFPENLLTTSGLSILLHGVISLPDATSYDKEVFLPDPGFFIVSLCVFFNYAVNLH